MKVITQKIFFRNVIKIRSFLNPNYPHCSVTSFSSKIIYGLKKTFLVVVMAESAIMKRN